MDEKKSEGASLSGWIMEKVNAWEEWRKQNYDSRWDEYYRIWRGFWTEGDRNRGAERSRIICPELGQAVETCVAELEDATFIRDRWLDVSQDVMDPGRTQELGRYLNVILDDYAEYGVTQAVGEVFFNGALYGTGIGKVVVEKVEEPIQIQEAGISSLAFEKVFRVRLIPIAPRNFVIDPAGRTISEALGCAHVLQVPLTVVQKRISDDTYLSFPLSSYGKSVEDLNSLAEFDASLKTQFCKVVEWHGLVPKKFLDAYRNMEPVDELEQAIGDMTKLDSTLEGVNEDGDGDMVEALVVVINDQYIAKAVENPFLFGDRSIIAYQHDTVPNRFWGRGVAEKGYNPQKALDAEIRARIDALGLSTHPMMAMDATKIPRGERYEVRPGRNILFNGNPAEAMLPIKFPPPDPHTFQQTQELREMIQRATGGYELPAMMSDANRMAATSMSMVVGSMIKRSRRTLYNIDRDFLTPLVKKTLYRNMQFRPKEFPMIDYKFRVRATMGIMAREFEQGQLISLLSTVPQDSPAFWMLIKGIYENSTIDSRDEMIAFADQMLQASMNPEPPPPDPLVQEKLLRLQLDKDIHKDTLDLETLKLAQEKLRSKAEAEKDRMQAEIDRVNALVAAMKADSEHLKVQSETLLNLARAEYEKLRAPLEIQKEAHKQESAQAEPQKEDETSVEENTPAPDPSPEPETPEPVIPQTSELIEKFEGIMEAKMSKVMQRMQDMTNAPALMPSASATVDTDSIKGMIEDLSRKLESRVQPEPEEQPDNLRGMEIERGEDGLVKAVAGRPVKRDGNGRLAGLE